MKKDPELSAREVADRLQQFGLFKDIPESQLLWLAKHGDLKRYNGGDYIFKRGDEIRFMHLVLEGKIIMRTEQNQQFRDVGEIKAGQVTGLLPYSRAKLAQGYGMAANGTLILQVSREHIKEMINACHEITEVLVHTMTSRVRDFTWQAMQNEKLAALGKISAGLAHELNNPASAILRTSEELKKHVKSVPAKFKNIISVQLTPEQIGEVNRLYSEKLHAYGTEKLTMMERTDREDELLEWFEDNNINEVDDLSVVYAASGFTTDDLEDISKTVGPEYRQPVLEWLHNLLVTQKLVQEIHDASSRISALVNSVKEYSHMDQSQDRQDLNIRTGIETTLTMLNHKLRKKNIKVQVDIDPALPEICGYVSELNQVWTNLIDNAADAMNEGGALSIRADVKDGKATISFADNGVGIPENLQEQIFDPFFTTKKMGEGTGLGLDIVRKIIQHHEGEIEVHSKPGNTEFRIMLPVQ
ncbi:MAG: ATP-binding protein [Bacteroidia bacterium]